MATGLMFLGLMGQGAWFMELAWYWKVVIGLIALIVVALVLIAAYVLFMKKYYHLHEEYLKSLEK